VLVALGTSVVAGATAAATQTGADRPVTFTKDIAPILQRSCQQCHRPGSIAPMPLLTYEQARPYARAMKLRTLLARSQYGRGAMPPWFIEKNIGVPQFKDDISLSDEEIALFGTWADSGAPEGNPADMPPPRVFASAAEWTLGKPDLIVRSPSMVVTGTGPDWWGNPWEPQPIGLEEDRYLASVEYKEVAESKAQVGGAGGSLYVIHHTTAGIGGPVAAGETGSGASDADESGESGLPIHEIGRNGDVFPEDAGRLVKAGGTIVWGNVHRHPSGVEGDDRTVHIEVGLRFHPRGYRPRYESRAAGFGRSEIEIRANEANQKIESYWVAPQPVRLVNFEPHLHAAGVRMCLEAIYQRSMETLNCAGYDHNWVKNYQYDDDAAPLLPKGTILKATAWFDNTSKNANILEPRNAAGWGRRSVVNMLMAFEQMVFLTDGQYQELLAKRREYLDRSQGWDALVGCPDCWQRPTPARAGAR
jgi:cytochrome c5